MAKKEAIFGLEYEFEENSYNQCGAWPSTIKIVIYKLTTAVKKIINCNNSGCNKPIL
jgi:hypothetical protein